MKLYKVSFTIDDSYTPKADCWRNFSLVVYGCDQFDALRVAWNKLAPLNLPEPKEFNALRIGKDE